MIDAQRFVDEMIRQGALFFTGIPCSYLTPLINEVISRTETKYILTSSEGDALSIASGIWLAGGMAVVLCQNSGLGNMVNPLTSLNEPFSIPVLMLMTWRGKPGIPDEPQHKQMGQITGELLSLMGVKWGFLPDDDSSGLVALQHACDHIRREQKPYVLVISGDTFISNSQSVKPCQENHFSRADALATFLDNVDERAVVVATTGKTGRELFSLDDRQGHLYCVGSMGYASSIAHGIALVSTRPVYLLDGDGAAIMHLGNLTSIGSSRPANLTHIVLDNGCYDSTGGQPTASASVDFAAVALAVGYSYARECRSAADLCVALRSSVSVIGPKLLHVRINAGSISQLGRPTQTPYTVARRLRRLLIDGERPLATGLSRVDVDAGADVDSHPERVGKYHT